MLRDKLKQEIDKLKHKASAQERAEEFKQWAMQLPKNINNSSLSNEAFSRDSIYD